jgi:hypothetical protein
MSKKGLTELEKGALVAIAVLHGLHGVPELCADTIHEMGLAHSDCSGLDAFDKKQLSAIQRANRLSGRATRLRGLNKKGGG